MHLILILAFVLPSAAIQPPQAAPDAASAFAKIGAERNPETKKKLALSFEKNFPTSKHLAEVYIDLSRTLAMQGDYTAARQYGEKAVSTVTKMKSQPAPPENTDATWRQWLNTLDDSAKKNLAWVNQMAAWQQQQVRSTVLGRK
jgi:hypothetical protein